MKPEKYTKLCSTTLTLLASVGINAEESDKGNRDGYSELEEVIVTAQKYDTQLQNTPIAISVLNEKQIVTQGISSLGDITDGTIPSLRIHPFGSSPSTLVMAIRGNGPGDVGQATRDSPVAVYLDDFYLGRSNGLNMELADLERIEVLRGPQGSLFGRNATGGAISLISKRPSGKFGLKQKLGLGRFNQFSSTTHLNLPEWAGLRTKLDYLHTERDGWVDNTANGEADYNAYEKKGVRLSVDRDFGKSVELNYVYSNTHTDMTANYYQLLRDDIGDIGPEPERVSTTRFPISPLDPTQSDQQLHSLKLNWTVSDNIKAQSLSSYRELDDRTRNNFGGALYYNGLIEAVDLDQEQYSQEFRLLGSHNRVEWVTGLYYYKENVNEIVRNLFSLDIFGNPDLGVSPLTPINPPIEASPKRVIIADLQSFAIYGQATWNPPVLDDSLKITLGLRHSQEDRSGERLTGGSASFDLDTTKTDPTVTVEYHINDDLFTYAKWSSAYRSGGVHSRSSDFTPFNQEEVDTFELGLKSVGWRKRLLLNIALFSTRYDNMFIDVQPENLEFTETINADNTVKIDGGELELTVIPSDGFTIGLNYTYLSGKIPLQSNPYNNNALESFNLTQTPRHAGSLSFDYIFPSLSYGKFIGHLDIVSSSRYHRWASGGPADPGGYTLANARLTLTDIKAGSKGTLEASLWIKNITNEAYSLFANNLGVVVINAYNDPRTAGIYLQYNY